MQQKKHGRKEDSDSLPAKSSEPLLQRRLRYLLINSDSTNKFPNLKNGIYGDIGFWASLKLIFLDLYAGFYCNIINKYYKDNFFYVDLFSGCGVSEFNKSTGDLIFGSSLLMAQRNFKKLFLCEDNSDNGDNCKILEGRLLNFRSKNDFELYPEDCNIAIDKIIPQVEKGHSLIFIDPFGMEIRWMAMEKILKLNADIIINFQTPSIARGIVQGGKLTGAGLTFFKDGGKVGQIYSTSSSGTLGERLLSLYMQDIVDTRTRIDPAGKRTFIEKVRIRKDSTFYYDLIFVVRETSGSNPWLKEIEKYAKEIEKLDAKDVEGMLRILHGKQKVL
jgi:three-Cys-motif partner protein